VTNRGGRAAAGLVLLLTLVACNEGRWVHPTNTEEQAAQDWEICKAEVLSGVEHQKETLAGGVNFTGCMRSKGYTYVEDEAPRDPGANVAVPR
jgi:hypothetical protein